MSKVLISIDHSEHSKGAIEWYLKELHRKENEVILLHVMEFPFIPVQPIRADLMEDMLNKARQEGAATLEKYKTLLAEHGVQPKILSDFGDIGEFIVKVAATEKVGYVVMGCRGMGSIRRTILGSVSDYVLHHAHCPVCVHRH